MYVFGLFFFFKHVDYYYIQYGSAAGVFTRKQSLHLYGKNISRSLLFLLLSCFGHHQLLLEFIKVPKMQSRDRASRGTFPQNVESRQGQPRDIRDISPKRRVKTGLAAGHTNAVIVLQNILESKIGSKMKFPCLDPKSQVLMLTGPRDIPMLSQFCKISLRAKLVPNEIPTFGSKILGINADRQSTSKFILLSLENIF